MVVAGGTLWNFFSAFTNFYEGFWLCYLLYVKLKRKTCDKSKKWFFNYRGWNNYGGWINYGGGQCVGIIF